MKINVFSATFWFNIFNDHNDILPELQEKLKDEFTKFDVYNQTDNLVAPVISAVNPQTHSNISFSRINLVYNIESQELKDISAFRERILSLFEILSSNGVELLHTSLFINGEMSDPKALEHISNALKDTLYSKELVDATIKLGKCHEDLFYKIITVLNKKQVKFIEKTYEDGKLIPIPLISWNDCSIEQEIIDVSYEINDKYLFDHTKEYHTTEFYLNKMLYLLENDFEDDVKSLLEKAKF